CDWIHIDVMDGIYVPNMSFGFPIVEAIRRSTDLPLDCHLMIDTAPLYVREFAKAGADTIVVHPDACTHLHRVIQAIKDEGVSAGVALNPATPLSVLDEILPELDLVLLMSVNPGYGGQKYIPAVTDKIRRLRAIIDERGLDIHLQVDGGISVDTIGIARAAGANAFVAGSAVFNAGDPTRSIAELRAAARRGTDILV
ncbi:MAG: ribulose-phosphate 3-epimerase, partial [Clostridiaceae bacterium]|nr:ribulose-phosphate 3-epimerase [Clostridiaceae bacterium]